MKVKTEWNARKLLGKAFRFKPDASLVAVFLSIALVVASLSAATYLATPARGGVYFLLYAVLGAALCGFALPLSYTAFAAGRSPASLGVTASRLPLSLTVQVVCSLPLFPELARRLSGLTPAQAIPLVALALTIGFFEAVFWRGWVYGRLAEAFGVVPAMILGAALYALYHVGYGMPLSEMAFLFFIGLMFNAIFALTGSVFALWPVFQPSGQLITVVKDGLSLPPIATLGFLEVLFGMIAFAFFARRFFAGRRTQPGARRFALARTRARGGSAR